MRRPAERPDEVEWLTDPSRSIPRCSTGADAVVGLNGASIGRFPWTAPYKNTLLWSRITPTRALARAVRELGADAPAFVSASAVGYYGSAPGKRLTEDRRGASPSSPTSAASGSPRRSPPATMRASRCCAPPRSCTATACSSRCCC